MDTGLVIAKARLFAYLFFVSLSANGASEENFFLINGITDEVVIELGPDTQQRVTPCSTFKVALSLMGYNEDILRDAKRPTWDFQEGFVDFLESWKTSQTPQSWMKLSCVWYSQLLTQQLGLEKAQNYLNSFEYGNQDMSGGIEAAWLSSSLKISPREQVDFLKKMLSGKLPVSDDAVQKTRSLLLLEEVLDGWKLFGKTGMGSISGIDDETLAIGWFIGWIQKDDLFFPFAYNICEAKVDPSLRVLRVKQLIQDFTISHQL